MPFGEDITILYFLLSKNLNPIIIIMRCNIRPLRVYVMISDLSMFDNTHASDPDPPSRPSRFRRMSEV